MYLFEIKLYDSKVAVNKLQNECMHIWSKQGLWRTFHWTIFCLHLWEKLGYKNKSSTAIWQIENSPKMSHSLVTFHQNTLQSQNRSLLFNYLHSHKQRIDWCVKFGKFTNRRGLFRHESESRGSHTHMTSSFHMQGEIHIHACEIMQCILPPRLKQRPVIVHSTRGTHLKWEEWERGGERNIFP